MNGSIFCKRYFYERAWAALERGQGVSPWRLVQASGAVGADRFAKQLVEELARELSEAPLSFLAHDEVTLAARCAQLGMLHRCTLKVLVEGARAERVAALREGGRGLRDWDEDDVRAWLALELELPLREAGALDGMSGAQVNDAFATRQADGAMEELRRMGVDGVLRRKKVVYALDRVVWRG